jgi:hypothetical protein
MKFYLILFLQLVVLSVFSQDTITWANVYDFDVGDQFHYRENADGHIRKSECLILDRFLNPDSTEVFYVRDVIIAYRDSGWPLIVPSEITTHIDTVSYIFSHDTIIASDSVWASPDWYNNRWVHSSTSEGFFTFEKSYVKNLGQVRHRSTSYTDFGTYVLQWSLVYYYKAVLGEEWGTDVNILSNTELQPIEFNVYPNPTKGVLSWNSEGNLTGQIISVWIYDLQGKRLLTKAINNDQNTIDLSELSEGTYILELHTESGLFTERIVIQ